MQHKKSYVGPRGWALLTLVSGVALASPFFRAPDVEVDGELAAPPGSHTSGLARLASMEFPSTDAHDPLQGASGRGQYDQSNLAQRILPPASASPTELPSWAPVRSPIDQLISQGTAPPWQAGSKGASTLKPLTPWVNEAGAGQPRSAALSPTAATAARGWPDATSLPDARTLADTRRLSGARTLPSATPLPVVDRRYLQHDSANTATSGNVASAGSGSQGNLVGSLTGTSQTMRAATTPRLRAPELATPPPARRHFVYQPGYNENSQ